MPKLVMRLRFNGATTSRSWIPCDLRWLKSRYRYPSFNGATTSRSWIPLSLASHTPTPSTTRFNGATTSRSWILSVNFFDSKTQCKFQWGHNLSVMDTDYSYEASVMEIANGFNGATTSRSWIPFVLMLWFRSVRRCFNGATTSRSWIRRVCRQGF